MSVANNKSNSIELTDGIFKDGTTATLSYIKQIFIPYAPPTELELMKNMHPLMLYKFNRVIKDDSKSYSLFHIPVKELYAWEDKNEFCLYATIDIKSSEFLLLHNFLQEPDNVSFAEMMKGDFDILMWKIHGMDVTLFHDFAGRVSRDGYLIKITNMPAEKTINMTPP